MKKKFENFWSQNMPRRCHNFIWLLSCFGWNFWLWMAPKNFLCTFQARSKCLKGSPEPGLFNARWIECLRCVKHKLTLTKAQRISNFVLSSHIWSLMARSEGPYFVPIIWIKKLHFVFALKYWKKKKNSKKITIFAYLTKNIFGLELIMFCWA